ncbi:MAG TPA: GNAT family protein [Aggregatilineales bacterium]|nr:GNAT family protein [Aggregatilineales bacterium]
MSILGNELLQGEQVYLTAITKADVEAMHDALMDFEYLRYVSHNIAYRLTTPDKIIENYNKERGEQRAYTFVIRLKEGDTLLGICRAKNINWHSHACEVGIGITDPAMRGKGYGTDAMRVLLRYVFMELNLNRAELRVTSYNEAAIASYQKIGFKHEVTMREAIYRDLQYFDIYIMGMLYDEWREINGK